MIDIVVPLGGKCSWQDNELRFSLRGIEKYLTGYGKIFIVGSKRKWLTNVEYIDCQEHYTSKQSSIYGKLAAAAKDDRVSDPFCMFNDDHFLLKPLDLKDLKYYKSGTVKHLMALSEGVYKNCVRHTYRHLESNGWQSDNFDIHVPIIYEKEKILGLADEDWSRDHIIKSLYCNKYGIKGEEMKDLVIGVPLPKPDVLKAIEGRLFFSINEGGTNWAVKEVLKELYPDKSKFEYEA